MIKILLCGEGATDYGLPEFGVEAWIDGSVQPIIRKIIDADFYNVTKEKVINLKLQRTFKDARVKGHGIKSLKLSTIAREKAINYIICYVDSDKESSSKNSEAEAKKRFNEIYNQIREGFDAFNEISCSYKVEGVPMVPVRMIESWLLGDVNAFKKCFDNIPSNPALPKNPELIWGDQKNPNSDFPKCYLERVLKQYNKKSSSEIFKYIAQNVDVETLKENCPISFKKFIEDIEKWKFNNSFEVFNIQ